MLQQERSGAWIRRYLPAQELVLEFVCKVSLTITIEGGKLELHGFLIMLLML